MVPTSPHDALTLELVYPAVWLAYGDRIALLPATMVSIQGRLQRMTKALRTVWKTPPRIDMSYTYLMAWYVMHCSPPMHKPGVGPGDVLFL